MLSERGWALGSFSSASSTSPSMGWASAVPQGSWGSITAKPAVSHSLQAGKIGKQLIITPCGKCDSKQMTEYQAAARKAATVAHFQRVLFPTGCKGCGDQAEPGEVMSAMLPIPTPEPNRICDAKELPDIRVRLGIMRAFSFPPGDDLLPPGTDGRQRSQLS